MTALDTLARAVERFPTDTSLLLALARIHDALDAPARAANVYRQVLRLNAASVEAVASLAAHHFYNDQPETALRYYRRLL